MAKKSGSGRWRARSRAGAVGLASVVAGLAAVAGFGVGAPVFAANVDTPSQLTGNGAITAVNWANNWHLEIWVKGEDNQLYHSWTFDGLDWPALSPMASDIGCGFAAGHWPTVPDYVEVFLPTKTGAAQHIWWNEGGDRWEGPESYDADDMGDFSTLLWPDGRMEVFARTVDGGLKHRYWLVDEGQWSSWETFGEPNTFASGVAPITWGDGRPEVFATGKDGRIWNRWWDTDQRTWSDWSSTTIDSQGIASRPIPVRWDSGRLEVFARGEDDHLYHAWFFEGAWHGVARLSDTRIKGEPGVIFNDGGSSGLYGPQVFARDEHNHVVEIHMENNAWTDFARVNGNTEVASSPFAWVRHDGIATLFVIDRAGKLLQSRRGVTGWRAWSTIEGPKIDGCDARSNYLSPGNNNSNGPNLPDPGSDPSNPDPTDPDPDPGNPDPGDPGPSHPDPTEPDPSEPTNNHSGEQPTDPGEQPPGSDGGAPSADTSEEGDQSAGTIRSASGCASVGSAPSTSFWGAGLAALWALSGLLLRGRRRSDLL